MPNLGRTETAHPGSVLIETEVWNLAWPGTPNAKPNWSGNGTAAQNKNKTTGLLRSLDGSLSVSISIGGTLTVWM